MVSAHQKDRTWIGGRGTGKSYCIGASTYQKSADLPRAKGYFSSSTYHQILTKTLPPVEEMWQRMGLRPHISKEEPGHYIIGKRPPSNWIRPYSAPHAYKNAISFFNGFTIELLSMDRPDLARGGSYDFGEIDEATLVKEEHFNTVLQISTRANRHRFSHWSHHQISKYSSMPWKSDGLYLLGYQDKAAAYPDDFFYQESTTADNIKVLGPDYLKRMKMALPYHTYQVEILNQRSVRGEHSFYHAFNDNIHTYVPKYSYEDDGPRGIAFKGVLDRKKNEAINLSFDMSGWWKGCTAYQEDKGDVERMIGSFSVPKTKGLRELVNKICDTYQDQTMKHIEIWGEPRGHKMEDAIGGSSYQLIESVFNERGWSVSNNVQNTQAWTHDKRYDFINEILLEAGTILPKLKINQVTCKDVIIAINNTEVDQNFKKIKKNEKNRSFNQDHATHYTDTIDYYFVQKYSHRMYYYNDSFVGTVN